MKNTIEYLPTGEVFANRRDAKMIIGHSRYNRALKDGKIAFVRTYSADDIIM